MHPQTYSVFEALGSPSPVALIVELLAETGGVDELARRTGVTKSTVSRNLKELALAGVLSRPKWATYTVTCPEETRRLLEAASALASAILAARQDDETTFDRAVRKTRMRSQPEKSASSDDAGS